MSPPGSQSFRQVPPKPQGTTPTGTPNSSQSLSQKEGYRLPPSVWS